MLILSNRDPYIHCKLYCKKAYYFPSVDNNHVQTIHEMFTPGEVYDCYIEASERMIRYIYDENHTSNYLILVNKGSFPISSRNGTEPEHTYHGYAFVKEYFSTLAEFRESRINEILDESR